jgi:uncharacterized protein (TIGR02646 family)
MRRIDLNKLTQDATWQASAQHEQSNIDRGIKEAKNVGYIWSAAKPRLKSLSFGKCWYCETRENRSDDAVDHFRPKSLYPCFACDIKNFRYVCTFCNSIRKNPETGSSGGKGDYFPLLEGERATNDQQRNVEAYLLIDPCKAGDPGLLDFHDDGRPKAKHPETSRVRYLRATESIKAYHLDHPDLVEARRQIALQISDWVSGANLAYDELDQGHQDKHEVFSKFAESIGRAIASDAPFSVFAKKIVKGYSHYSWVEDILDCA